MISALSQSAVTVRINDSDIALVPLLIFVLLGLIFLLPATLLRRWYFYRRRIKRSRITADFVTPEGFNPAEIAYLFHRNLHDRVVGGMIIYLIQRSFLHIKKTEDGTKRIFAGPRVSNELKIYEAKLVEAADLPEGISAAELLHRFSSIRLADGVVGASKPFVFTQYVHADMQTKGYARKRSLGRFLFGSCKVHLILIGIMAVVPFGMLWLWGALTAGSTYVSVLRDYLFIALELSLLATPILIIVSLFFNSYRGRIVGREWIITPKLRKLWPQIVGYRQYVQLTEAYKLDFYSTDMKKTAKKQTLPYAVALGFVDNWREILN